MEKISAKRIIVALLPLIFFNMVLVADLLVFRKMAWSADKNEKKYIYGKDEKVYTAEKSRAVKDGDKVLYEYVGADANCYKLYDKDWQRQACRRDHPYGGQGTMIVGGNMVLENAQAIYLNGKDSAGYNWIMSSTSEPYGNAMGTRNGVNNTNYAIQANAYGTTDNTQDSLNFGATLSADGTIRSGVNTIAQKDDASVYYGNHLLADGTIRSGAVHFQAAGISVKFNVRSEWMVDEGVFEEVGRLVFLNQKYSSSPDVFSILEKGVCGICGETCAMGNAGKDYQFFARYNLDVKEVLKVNEQVRLCGYTLACEETCCRLTQYLEDDTYYNQAPYHNFVGYDCETTMCADEPPPDVDGVVYGLGRNGNDPTFCYPQPYPHYERKEIDYSVSYIEKDGKHYRK